MGFNIHILSVRNRSTNLPSHAALAASFNPMRLGERGHKMMLTAAVATRPGVAAAAVR